jgi:hypothetical protein
MANDASVKSDRNYELKDHKLCAVGMVRNCSICRYLEGCRAGYEGFAIGEKHRDKQLFKMVNPNAK